MNLKYHYWYFINPFSEKFINRILNQGVTAKSQLGVVGKSRNQKDDPLSTKEKEKLKKTRYSKVSFMSEPYIYDAISPFIAAANKKAGWNFQYTWAEPAQFSTYKKGMHYEWHMDSWETPYASDRSPNFVGKIRKLSFVLLLSDPKDYKGGEFEMDFTNGGGKGKRIITEIKRKGDFIVFPSFIWHRLKPVTKGTRHTMQIWYLGEPWK